MYSCDLFASNVAPSSRPGLALSKDAGHAADGAAQATDNTVL